MHRFTVTIAAATSLVAGAPIMGASVGAAPMVAPAAIRGAVDSLNVVERAQFIWLTTEIMPCRSEPFCSSFW